MTPTAPLDNVDLAHRFLDDPTGSELRSAQARLADLRFHLESSLKRPASKQAHRADEAALQAVQAALETLAAVARLWIWKYRRSGG